MHYIQKINHDFQNLLSILPESIAIYNEHKEEIILANQEFKKMFQCSASDDQQDRDIQEVMKKKIFQKQSRFSAEENLNAQKFNLLEAMQQNEEGSYFQIVDQFAEGLSSNTQDNQIVTFKHCNILFQDQETKLIIVYDLTSGVKYEQLKIEKHFYEMLTATVSHDMRTPLNAIIGLLSSLESFVNEERGKKFLDIISHSSKILLYLVNDLLDFFQIKNGKFRKNEQPVNVVSSVQTLLEIFRISSQEKGILVNFMCLSDIPQELIIDEQRVKQVLINLINNAFKFTFQGSITVYLSYDADLSKLKFTVRDTGIGIKQQDRDKLFALFGKLESTLSINTSGIGLGLNICKTILSAFDGEIYLEEQSSEVEGAAFTFTIRCKEQQVVIDLEESLEMSPHIIINYDDNLLLNHQYLDLRIETQEQQYFTSEYLNTDSKFFNFLYQPVTCASKRMAVGDDCPCLSRRKILVADDNIFNIVTLETIIEFQFKLLVDRSLNGKAAVEKVQSRIDENLRNPCFCGENNQNYLMILMDCNMPVMDGFQATGEIKRLAFAHNFDIKIVALTAFTTDNFKDKCFNSGMDGFLTKPIAGPQLKEIMQQHNIIR